MVQLLVRFRLHNDLRLRFCRMSTKRHLRSAGCRRRPGRLTAGPTRGLRLVLSRPRICITPSRPKAQSAGRATVRISADPGLDLITRSTPPGSVNIARTATRTGHHLFFRLQARTALGRRTNRERLERTAYPHTLPVQFTRAQLVSISSETTSRAFSCVASNRTGARIPAS